MIGGKAGGVQDIDPKGREGPLANVFFFSGEGSNERGGGEGWDEMGFTSYEIDFNENSGFCYWPSPEFCGLEM